jgi:DNA-binding NarL/FixJ family response regulator
MIISVAIQHEERFLREGLALLLEREPDIDVAGCVASGAELVQLCADRRPAVALLELDRATVSPTRVLTSARKRQKGLRFVGLYDTIDRASAQQAHRSGVRATYSYRERSELLVAAVRGRASAPVITQLPTRADVHTSLTPREIEVLQLIGNGLMTRQISEVLGISPKTVENHKQRIFLKLGVQNQAHAVSVALRRGYLGGRSHALA